MHMQLCVNVRRGVKRGYLNSMAVLLLLLLLLPLVLPLVRLLVPHPLQSCKREMMTQPSRRWG